MKMGFALAMMVAISGQVLYHFMQKQVAPGAHPVLALIAFYVGAAVLSLPLLLLFPLQTPLAQAAGELGGAVWGVAAAIVLIELGFLLAYRSGASLSSAFVLSAAAVATALLLVGLAVFKEAVSLKQIAGLALCLAGIWLLSGNRPAH
jgi:drug/metabolite transporter (DMT)-like permease